MSRVQTPARRAVRKPRPAAARPETLADLLAVAAALGVPPGRVRLDPLPGTATEADLLRRSESEHLCELVNGTLVDKPMGAPESHVALELGFHLRLYLVSNPAGYLCGADVLVRLSPGTVRGPDVCFVGWSREPGRAVAPDPVSVVVPHLAVEVLSKSNRKAEITRKLGEYFAAGVELVWVIDPRARTADVHTAPDTKVTLAGADALTGGAVLPGFTLPLATLFAHLRPPPAKPKPAPRKKP